MTELIKKLCSLNGVSGREDAVRDFIISEIDGFCEWQVDALGNILVKKKGKSTPKNLIMFDAHMDEVGFIVTKISEDGFLSFKTVGGIETEALLFRRVVLGNGVKGVIGGKPIHLTHGDEGKKLPDRENLYIDIGATSGTEAENAVSVGETGVIEGEFYEGDGLLLSKALDDRVGCAALISLIKRESEYDFCASFSVAEEIGCRGCRTAAYSLSPDIAIVLEGTTAADISGTPDEKSVCNVGGGVAVSFMDGGCMYDRALYDFALNCGISVQPKRGTSGGNDSAGIHLVKEGIRTLALSVPCRYIHSASSVCSVSDCVNMLSLCEYMLKNQDKL